MKTNKTKFRLLVKKYRKELKKAGFKVTTINSWIYTKRVPFFDSAVKMSPIIGLPVAKIPYIRIEKNT